MHYCVFFLVLQSLKRKRELVALLLLSYGCLVTVNVLWLFPLVSWVGLLCVIVFFSDHTQLLFEKHNFCWSKYFSENAINSYILIKICILSHFLKKWQGK